MGRLKCTEGPDADRTLQFAHHCNKATSGQKKTPRNYRRDLMCFTNQLTMHWCDDVTVRTLHSQEIMQMQSIISLQCNDSGQVVHTSVCHQAVIGENSIGKVTVVMADYHCYQLWLQCSYCVWNYFL